MEKSSLCDHAYLNLGLKKVGFTSWVVELEKQEGSNERCCKVAT